MATEPTPRLPHKRKTSPLDSSTDSVLPSQLRHRLEKETLEKDESARQRPSTKLSWREWCRKWEVPRKLLHSSIGFITLQRYMATGNPSVIVVYLSKALAVIWLADMARFRYRRFAYLYEALLGFLMRPSEKHNWNGVIFYLLGVIVSLTTLPLDISVLSILILSWVDTSASVLGRLYGSHTSNLPSPPFARQKSLAGFLGAFATGTLTSSFFWTFWAGLGPVGQRGYSWAGVVGRAGEAGRSSVLDYLLDHRPPKLAGQLGNPHSTLPVITLCLGCGLVGALAEAVDVFGWDDNLIVPVLSGWGIWGLMKVFG